MRYIATETLIVAIVHTTAGNTLQQRNYTTNFSPLLTRKRERNEAKHEIASRTVERKKKIPCDSTNYYTITTTYYCYYYYYYYTIIYSMGEVAAG